MVTDKIIPSHVYDKTFTVRFLDRREWKYGFQTNRRGELVWHTGSPKTNKRTGAEMYVCDNKEET
jgi:hypothetical protein